MGGPAVAPDALAALRQASPRPDLSGRSSCDAQGLVEALAVSDAAVQVDGHEAHPGYAAALRRDVDRLHVQERVADGHDSRLAQLHGVDGLAAEIGRLLVEQAQLVADRRRGEDLPADL